MKNLKAEFRDGIQVRSWFQADLLTFLNCNELPIVGPFLDTAFTNPLSYPLFIMQ